MSNIPVTLNFQYYQKATDRKVFSIAGYVDKLQGNTEDTIYISKWSLRQLTPACIFRYLHTYYWQYTTYARCKRHSDVVDNFQYKVHGQSLRDILRPYSDKVRLSLRDVRTILSLSSGKYEALGAASTAQALSTFEYCRIFTTDAIDICPRYRVARKAKADATPELPLQPEVIDAPKDTAQELMRKIESDGMQKAQVLIPTSSDVHNAHITLNVSVRGAVFLQRRPNEPLSKLMLRISDMDFSDEQLLCAGSEGCTVQIVATNEHDTQVSSTLPQDVMQELKRIAERWAAWEQ